MSGISRAEAMALIQAALRKMAEEESLPVRAAVATKSITESSRLSDLGMDSLARFTLMGEINRALGRKIDPNAASAADSVKELLDLICSMEVG